MNTINDFSTPPPGTRLMGQVRWALLAVLAVFAAGAVLWYFGAWPFGAADGAAGTYYRCPMHPQIVQERPGACPICGMDLVAFDPGGAAPEEAAAHEGHGDAAARPGQWTCPMHAQIVQDEPGECPICGMDLVQQRAREGDGPAPEPLPAVHSEVHLDARRLQMVGVTTGVVEKRSLADEIRTVALITADESKLGMVHTKVPGWIEHLAVSRVGERVRHGQLVARLYSLELIAAQEDFLAARDNAKALGEIAGEQGSALLDAARRRLRLLDMSEKEIARLESTGEIQRTVGVYAMGSGVVLTRDVTEGHKVEGGTTIMTLADLSSVWAMLDLYENDLAVASKGQTARVTLNGLPGRVFEGRVDYVYPVMDEKTRTTKARVVLKNKDGALRPGMYGTGRIAVDPRDSLVVPPEAVMDNGDRRYVFTVESPGHFVPRPVTVGRRTDAGVEILSGLSEGETIVTSGNFLLDAESRMLGVAQAGVSDDAGAHAGH
ncbi:MAG: efflux RND transporter periplasmic adaptor subunit [Deltaproteobacteria bacterium]|nr:efflux RND transporter periplasmic adaptor subunit [Deltaproteobacteria bacterium]